MGWKTRGNHAYEYRAVRLGDRVATHYVGTILPAEVALAIREDDARHRAERAAALTSWRVELEELAEAERAVIEVDEAYGEVADLAMTAAGYHRPGRGRWRRRRGDGNAFDESALDALIRRLEGDPGRPGPPPSVEVRALGEALVGPDAGALEGRLGEWMATAWSDAVRADVMALEAGVPEKSRRGDHLDRLRSRATARLLVAARSLAEVRRLAVPALRAIPEEDRPGLVNLTTPNPSTTLPMGYTEPKEQDMPKKIRGEGKKDMPKKTRCEDQKERIITLVQRTTQGDHDAFEELKAIDRERGIDRLASWSQFSLEAKLQSRASPKNLLDRGAVSADLKSVARDLAEPSDGPIEKLLIRRAAVCAVDAGLADREHVWAVTNNLAPATAEHLDRRRDRAHRRLLQTLRTLAQVRRLNSRAIQINVGDGNVNMLKA